MKTSKLRRFRGYLLPIVAVLVCVGLAEEASADVPPSPRAESDCQSKAEGASCSTFASDNAVCTRDKCTRMVYGSGGERTSELYDCLTCQPVESNPREQDRPTLKSSSTPLVVTAISLAIGFALLLIFFRKSPRDSERGDLE